MAEDYRATAEKAPELRRGSTGDWVLYLKQMLDRWENTGAFAGKIDENFDRACEQAVKDFQMSTVGSVEVTGVVDKRTWLFLLKQVYADESGDAWVADELDVKAVDPLDKVATGGEVGRKGWQRVDFWLTVNDHFGLPWNPQSDAYIRFTDQSGDISDESGFVKDGQLHLNDIWVPNNGFVSVYVESRQWQPNGWTGTVSGVGNLLCKGKNVHFKAKQETHQQQTLTLETAIEIAHTHGKYTEQSYEAGVDIGISLGVELVGHFGSGGVTGEVNEQTVAFGLTQGHGITVDWPAASFDVNQIS
jgi:hypothetical protein